MCIILLLLKWVNLKASSPRVLLQQDYLSHLLLSILSNHCLEQQVYFQDHFPFGSHSNTRSSNHLQQDLQEVFHSRQEMLPNSHILEVQLAAIQLPQPRLVVGCRHHHHLSQRALPPPLQHPLLHLHLPSLPHHLPIHHHSL